MPYSGNPPIPRTKYAWARLNADALFLALLVGIAGIAGIVDPARDDIVRELGKATPSHYLIHFAYVISGFLLMLALMKEWVSAEVTARVTLTWAVGFNLVREVIAFGWWPDGITPFILFAIVVLTTLLRLSVLLSKKGIVVHLPQRENNSESLQDGEPES